MTALPVQSSALPRTGIPRPNLVEPAFGSSSRYWGRPNRDREHRDDDEDEHRPRQSGTYRTMCVRLCDGFYFPLSFAATPERFARDARTCEKSCSGQARLFVYRNPGADVQDMVDLQGRPYRQLSTAFRYRTEYVAACKCKPDPWEQEARDRHRLYALVAAKQKGNRQAAAEFDALSARLKQGTAANRPEPEVAAAEATSAPAKARPSSAPTSAPQQSVDAAGRMALGARPQRQSGERPSQDWRRQPDWASRAFDSAN
jgi:hypothetical protein